MIITDPETFTSLLHNKAHWEFEIFLMIVFDGVIGGIFGGFAWPFVKKHWQHHVDRDKQDAQNLK